MFRRVCLTGTCCICKEEEEEEEEVKREHKQYREKEEPGDERGKGRRLCTPCGPCWVSLFTFQTDPTSVWPPILYSASEEVCRGLTGFKLSNREVQPLVNVTVYSIGASWSPSQLPLFLWLACFWAVTFGHLVCSPQPMTAHRWDQALEKGSSQVMERKQHNQG